MPLYTKEEWDAAHVEFKTKLIENRDVIQRLCTEVAVHKPIKFWGRGEAEPWGCILAADGGMEYCDECPVQDDCPYDRKRWSK